ncbi:MAG: hypothetical protein DHS20C18_32590 [Saprospiraceae bacterium]|nr:MAG: hypothetical protein DHS20C18_32590 [Saprospiraceae bacterium]
MKSIFKLALCLSLLSGCTKNSGPLLDNGAPSIAIFAPTIGAILTPGQPFPLRVSLTELQEIHFYRVVLHSPSTGFDVTLKNEHLDAVNFEIDEMVTMPNLQPGAYKLEVIANDHNGNSNKASVEVILE